MHERDFELLYELEENYWWFPAMREITDTIAARELNQPNLQILDAGCGTGFNLDYYAAGTSREVYGLDLATAALKHVHQRGFTKVAQASITDIPFKSEAFDYRFLIRSRHANSVRNTRCITARDVSRVETRRSFVYSRSCVHVAVVLA
jgi:SAM-dependent methyltransferase